MRLPNMRQDHQMKHANALCSGNDAEKPLHKSLVGKPLLISLLAVCISTPAWAEAAMDSPYIDISDPSVSVDLSVLDDGGRQPEMSYYAPNAGAPMKRKKLTLNKSGTSQLKAKQVGTSNGRYMAPNVATPTSTLYIQPSLTRHLPPQTKALTAKSKLPSNVHKAVASLPTPKRAQHKTMAKNATPPPAPILQAPPALTGSAQEIVAVATPPAPATTLADKAIPTTVAKVTPPAKITPAPVKIATAPAPKDIPPKAIPTAPAPQSPIPAPALAKVEPVQKDLAKVNVPAQPKTAPKIATKLQTPPPPPQALTQTAKIQAEAPVVPVKAAQAPKTSHTVPPSNTVVVDIPAKDNMSKPNVASLPPASQTVGDGDNMRIVFEASSSKLPQDARDSLKSLAAQIQGKDTLRLQLLAYAGNADTSASAARRLSLSRALAVRSYLIESGVRSTRIDVRALGNKSSEDVTERVDITVVER